MSAYETKIDARALIGRGLGLTIASLWCARGLLAATGRTDGVPGGIVLASAAPSLALLAGYGVALARRPADPARSGGGKAWVRIAMIVALVNGLRLSGHAALLQPAIGLLIGMFGVVSGRAERDRAQVVTGIGIALLSAVALVEPTRVMLAVQGCGAALLVWGRHVRALGLLMGWRGEAFGPLWGQAALIGFGGWWLTSGIAAMGVPTEVAASLAVTGGAVLAVAALRRFSGVRSVQREADGRLFGLAVGGEILGIIGGAWLCSVAHVPDLFGSVIGRVVGLHFLPLARAFAYPPYRDWGAAMAVSAFASAMLPMPARVAAVGLLMGACLWGCAVGMQRTRRIAA